MQTALEIAEREGMRPQHRGDRHWTNCPAHEDKTPSLCIYPDGGFYCFSCHAHGRGPQLYALIHGQPMPAYTPRAPSAAKQLYDRLNKLANRQNTFYCDLCNVAREANPPFQD